MTSQKLDTGTVGVLQNLQWNTFAGVSFLKMCRLESSNFIKKETLQQQVFSINFPIFLWAPFFDRILLGDDF